MKKGIIIIATVIIVIIVLWLIFFETIGLVIKDDNEKIINVSIYDSAIAVVTDKGDVYVEGSIDHNRNFGLDHVREYNHLLSGKYARIYDKKDAVLVSVSKTGGCIVTDQDQVYLFINGSEDYYTPTLFCSGYKKAKLIKERVYLLSCEGFFGYVNISEPDIFYTLGENVVDFKIECRESNNEADDDSIFFVLTKDNCLFVLAEDEAIAESKCFISDIIDFDTVSFCSTLPKSSIMKDYVEISLLDHNRNAYWYEVEMENAFDKISNIDNYTLTGNNVDKVVSYNRGIAMINSKKTVSLYGYDFDWWNEEFFQSEVMFSDVFSVFSGSDSLIILFENGDVHYYRYENYFGDNNSITQ